MILNTKLENDQLDIYKKIKKKFFLNVKSSELDMFNFLSNSDNFSWQYIKYIQTKKNILKLVFYYIKNIFSFHFHSYEIYKSKIEKNSNKLIITWGKNTDFDKKGNFVDRYSGLKSKLQKKTIWVVQYEEDKFPDKIASNIILFKKEKKKAFYLSTIIKIINEKEFNFNFLNNLSYNSLYAVTFFNKILPEVKNINFNTIFMPFEGQLFQKYFIKKIKKQKKKLKVIGLIHTFLEPIPFNLFYNKLYSPDKLIVNSISQKECLTKYMNWNKKLIFIETSKRFSRFKNLKNNSMIFFPYKFGDKKFLESIFLDFIANNKNILLPNLKVKLHPEKVNNIEHIKFKERILRILSKKKNKVKNFSKVSIFFESTSAIIESLEKGKRVIQICSNPTLQVYTPKFWKGIFVTKLADNVFEYKILKKNILIKMNS
jgi:hypothetical protein